MSFLLDLPFISSFFFILAGILIGHLLWFHDRSADTEKMSGLENRYFKARGSARQRKREFVKLQKNSQHQEDDLAQQNEQLATLRNKNADLDAVALEAGDEIKRLSQENETLKTGVTNEESRSESLVSQLKESLQQKTAIEKDSEGRQATFTQLQTSHQELESEIERLRGSMENHAQTIAGDRDEISQLKSDLSKGDEQLQFAQRQQQTLDSEVGELKQLLEAQVLSSDQGVADNETTISLFQAEIDELRQSLGETQTDLVARCEDLDELRQQRDGVTTQRDEFSADLESAAHSLGQQRQLLESREEEVDQFKEELVNYRQKVDATHAQLTAVETDNESIRSEIEQVSSEKQALQTQVDQLAPLRNELSEIESVLTQQRSINQQRVEKIETQGQAIKSMEVRLEQVTELESQLTLATQQSESVKDENGRLHTLLKERDETIEGNQVQIGHWESTAKNLEVTAEQKDQEMVVQQKQISDLNDQQSQLQDDRDRQTISVTDLRKQVTSKSQQYDKSLSEITNLTQTLGEQRESLTKLAVDLKNAEDLRPKNEFLMTRIDELMTHLKRVNAEHEDSLEANAGALDRIRDLETDLHGQAAKIRELRRERGSIRDLEGGEGEIRRAA